MPIKWDLSKLIDKKYRDLPLEEILKAPVHAIKGVSEKDAELLKKALGIKTVKDLAESKYVAIAQAITMISEFWEKALDKEFEAKSPKELVDAPVRALSGVTEEDEKLLTEALNIKTIRDLATNKFVFIAQVLRALANLEKILEEMAKEEAKE